MIEKTLQLRAPRPKLKLACLVTFFFFFSLIAWSQTVREEESGRLSVVANGTPLERLFREMSEKGLIDAALIDPEIGTIPITLEAHELTPAQAIVTVLEAAGVAFTLQSTTGETFSIVVESQSEADEIAPPPTSPLGPGEPPDPSLYEPARRREVTGNAIPSTGAASLAAPASADAAEKTLFILGVGFLLGIVFLKPCNHAPRLSDKQNRLDQKWDSSNKF